MSSAVEVKEEANKLFGLKQFQEAAGMYQEGVDLLLRKDDVTAEDNEMVAVLYGNLAACLYQMKDWEACEEASRASLRYNRLFIKSSYRLAQSLYQRSLQRVESRAHLLKEAKLVLLATLLREKSSTISPMITSCAKMYRRLESEHIGE